MTRLQPIRMRSRGRCNWTGGRPVSSACFPPATVFPTTPTSGCPPGSTEDPPTITPFSRGRQIRHLLTEALLLASLGGTFGVLLAAEFGSMLWALVPTNLSQQLGLTEVPLHPRLLAFALAVVICSALLAGSLPALQASRADLDTLLRGAPQRTDPGGRRRLMSAFVAGQIALAVLLLSAAGLVIVNFRLLRRGQLGFDERQLLTAEIELPRQ